MKAEFLNPFVYAGMKVLSAEAGLKKWVPDKPYLVRLDATRQPVSVVVGVVGSVTGLVIFGMSLAVAKGLVRAMAGSTLSIKDPLAESAIGEVGNLITGLASGLLEENGYPCRISPPALVVGTAVRITAVTVPMVAVPITTELGEIKIFLGLNELHSAPDSHAKHTG
ncbi:MAG TPA: chemotaxis protein CheX [Symbiobacteriaceae bacterium]|nr:chemotaxis protein CheX [Symbiobacteriaceae bacterium]